MRLLFSIAALLFLSACSDLGYYLHSGKGHLALMNKRVDIEKLLVDPEFNADLKQRLNLVQAIRGFSISHLSLPDSGSYTNYAELDQPYVLKNLFAAPEFSTRLHRWCYPVVGCASYRGYYDEELLNEYTDQLSQKNYDIYVGLVPAYSTLGWFDDPVLSSFVNWPDYRLAGLLFHELTHQRIYIDGDSQFNESLATAVQQAGTELWLESKGNIAGLEEYRRWVSYRREVVNLIEQTRDELARLYQSDLGTTAKRDEKQRILRSAADAHAPIADTHQFKGGFTPWFADGLNNAKLASVSTYNTLTPAFISILEAHDKQFSAFFQYIEDIGDLDKDKRRRCLSLWAAGKAKIGLPCA